MFNFICQDLKFYIFYGQNFINTAFLHHPLKLECLFPSIVVSGHLLTSLFYSILLNNEKVE